MWGSQSCVIIIFLFFSSFLFLLWRASGGLEIYNACTFSHSLAVVNRTCSYARICLHACMHVEEKKKYLRSFLIDTFLLPFFPIKTWHGRKVSLFPLLLAVSTKKNIITILLKCKESYIMYIAI